MWKMGAAPPGSMSCPTVMCLKQGDSFGWKPTRIVEALLTCPEFHLEMASCTWGVAPSHKPRAHAELSRSNEQFANGLSIGTGVKVVRPADIPIPAGNRAICVKGTRFEAGAARHALHIMCAEAKRSGKTYKRCNFWRDRPLP